MHSVQRKLSKEEEEEEEEEVLLLCSSCQTVAAHATTASGDVRNEFEFSRRHRSS